LIPQTHSEVVRKLCDLLDNITDPASGKKVHPIFHHKQDVFQGRYQDEAPDLCVELFDGDKKVQVNPRLNSGRVWSSNPHFSAIHSRDGFWALAGPQVRQGLTLDASILDMAPTLSRLLSLGGGEDFDGHVVESAFSIVEAS